MSARRFLLPLLALAALAAAGCSESGPELASSDPLAEGQQIFNERCAGCHTFAKAGAEGSAVEPNGTEYKDGPNFNERKEHYEDVLYAIENGGFSSGPMPQNIVTGREAQLVACYIATYSGEEAQQESAPGGSTETESEPRDCVAELTQ